MCVPSLSIPHFVPIISKGMEPNNAVHKSIRATEATTSENGDSGEQEEDDDAEDAEPKERGEKNMI